MMKDEISGEDLVYSNLCNKTGFHPYLDPT